MSPNRRIFLNIIATYGRSLYALVCGLLICRSVLAAVGKSEIGLCGVVGGMMVIEVLAGTMRLDRISPEAVGRAARFACRVAIRLPDEQREEPCAARSQEVERSLEGCGIAAVGCSSMGAGSIGGKNYCGNLLWQSSLTLLPPKYIHNVFGAYKVTYFNAAKEYVEKMGGDWAKVHTGVLLSGYINDTHTYVPGPDGKFGYGGKCFPKDVNAFAKMTQGTSMGTLLAPLHELNVHFRGVEEHI